ncbi:MAG: hypothetical protein ACR2NV_00300 [Thermoleophilaceae bacterium]
MNLAMTRPEDDDDDGMETEPEIRNSDELAKQLEEAARQRREDAERQKREDAERPRRDSER